MQSFIVEGRDLETGNDSSKTISANSREHALALCNILYPAFMADLRNVYLATGKR